MVNEIRVDPEMIEWYRIMLKTIPHPDESSTDDGTEQGPPTLQETLDCLVDISNTGSFASQRHERCYNEAKQLYQEFIENQ